MNFFRELMQKPWLDAGGETDPAPGNDIAVVPKATLGLRIIMLVATVLFSLFIISYSDRMVFSDWKAMPEPWLLWPNTLMLVFGSAALHWATVSARRGRADDARIGLLTGGGFSLAFLFGQVLVWQELIGLGYFAASNAANAFFYVLTALHGLHVLGGLFALGRALVKMYRGTALEDMRQSIDLCAIYWHFLFVVWLVLFGLLLFT
ncbi:MAG: cytochrome c oxidase subunit 3 [Alphaproteobacteria bacterium]|nr:cytochrome c oxidase subunit 3 [Alphaproteobacteria bacterium]